MPERAAGRAAAAPSGAAFRGAVRCIALGDARFWRLEGSDHRDGQPLTAWLSARAPMALPATLQGAELQRAAAEAPAGAAGATGGAGAAGAAGAAVTDAWLLGSASLAAPLALRSVQLQREAGAGLQALLAPPPAPLRMRIAAWLLLNLLRVPGVAGWLAQRRGG